MYTNAVLVCLSAHCNTSVLSCLLQMQIIMLAILCISLIFTLTFVYYTTYCMYNRNNVSVMTFFFLAVF